MKKQIEFKNHYNANCTKQVLPNLKRCNLGEAVPLKNQIDRQLYGNINTQIGRGLWLDQLHDDIDLEEFSRMDFDDKQRTIQYVGELLSERQSNLNKLIENVEKDKKTKLPDSPENV